MMHDATITKQQRPYPWVCPECGDKAVTAATIDRTAMMKHDGALHEVRVRDLAVSRCESCGEILFGNRADEQMQCALRDHLGLLQPEQIRAQRRALGIDAKTMAEHLGLAAESLSRWENGRVIQSRSSDRMIRAYFALPHFRQFVAMASDAARCSSAVRWLPQTRTMLTEWRPAWRREKPGEAVASGGFFESILDWAA